MSSDADMKVDHEQVSALLDAWDPIGVYEDAEDAPPPGEYTRLVPPILTKLRTGDDEASLAAYLTWDATTNMGLTRVAGAQEAARRLVSWWQQNCL